MMAHFAKVEDGIVTSVLVVPDEEEHRGQDYLNELGIEGVWIKTSYNTSGNVHALGGTPLRKNFAGIGYSYDAEWDAFYPPSPFPSWTLDKESGVWEAPTPMPDDGGFYFWDETLGKWTLVVADTTDYEVE